jgi:hypothetical protein
MHYFLSQFACCSVGVLTVTVLGVSGFHLRDLPLLLVQYAQGARILVTSHSGQCAMYFQELFVVAENSTQVTECHNFFSIILRLIYNGDRAPYLIDGERGKPQSCWPFTLWKRPLFLRHPFMCFTLDTVIIIIFIIQYFVWRRSKASFKTVPPHSAI